MSIVVEGERFFPLNVPCDGNCMFHAICRHHYFVTRDYNAERLRKELVVKVIKEIKNNELMLRKIEDKLKIDSGENVEEYLARINVAGVWCGEFEAMLISYFYPVVVKVARPSPKQGVYYHSLYASMMKLPLPELDQNQDRENIHILFYDLSRGYAGTLTPFKDNPNHFLFLRPSGEKVPESENFKVLQKVDAEYIDSSDDELEVDRKRPNNVQEGSSESVDLTKEDSAISMDMAIGLKAEEDDGYVVDEVTSSTQVSKECIKIRNRSLSISQWYGITHCYNCNRHKFGTHLSFLEHSKSDPLTTRDRSLFARNYKLYCLGQLASAPNAKRIRRTSSSYAAIESRLLDWIDKHRGKENKNLISLTRTEFSSHAIQIWEAVQKQGTNDNVRDFTASSGWLSCFQKRNGLKFTYPKRVRPKNQEIAKQCSTAS